MPEPGETDLLQARTGFIDMVAPNVPVPVRARSIARKGHPVVERNPSMWVPLTVDYDVEPEEKTTKSYGGRKGTSA